MQRSKVGAPSFGVCLIHRSESQLASAVGSSSHGVMRESERCIEPDQLSLYVTNKMHTH